MQTSLFPVANEIPKLLVSALTQAPPPGSCAGSGSPMKNCTRHPQPECYPEWGARVSNTARSISPSVLLSQWWVFALIRALPPKLWIKGCVWLPYPPFHEALFNITLSLNGLERGKAFKDLRNVSILFEETLLWKNLNCAAHKTTYIALPLPSVVMEWTLGSPRGSHLADAGFCGC